MPKYYLIVNPASGHKKGLTILKGAIAVLERSGIDVDADISLYKNHPFELVYAANLQNYDAICVIGGDGTMHEVINGMLKRKDKIRKPIGIIPGGTGNSLMHDLDALDPEKAIKNILFNQLRKLDIFEIRSEGANIYGFNILGWGLPVDVNNLAEKMRWMGSQRYNAASLIMLFKNKSRSVQIKIDNQTIEGPLTIFLACNTQFTGNGMKMAPQALIDDGYIDILLVRKISILKLLFLFVKVFKGKHIHDKHINAYRAKSFSILTDISHGLNIDGQSIGQCPVQVRMLDQQIEVFG